MIDIPGILADWSKNDLKHGQIKDKYNISSEIEFAITECSNGLTHEQIKQRIRLIQPGMKGKTIKEIMQNPKSKI